MGNYYRLELTGNVSTQSYIEKTTPTADQCNKVIGVSVYIVFTPHGCRSAAVYSRDVPYAPSKDLRFRCQALYTIRRYLCTGRGYRSLHVGTGLRGDLLRSCYAQGKGSLTHQYDVRGVRNFRKFMGPRTT